MRGSGFESRFHLSSKVGSRFAEFKDQRYVSSVEMGDCIETDGSVSLEFMNPM